MRRLVVALVGMLIVFGALVPVSADTRNETQYYGRPLSRMEFRLNGDETSATIAIEDDLHINVAGYYSVEKYGCTGGGGGYGGGGSNCTTITYRTGYFCRFTTVEFPSSSSIYVELVAPGLNKFYCGNWGGGIKGQVRVDLTYTPAGGGGGCAVAPAYRTNSNLMGTRTRAARARSGELVDPLLPAQLGVAPSIS